MKQKRKKALLLCAAIVLSTVFSNAGMAKTEDTVQKIMIKDDEREEIAEATVSDATLKNVDINSGDDFEIEGTTLVKYRGNEKRVVIPDGIETLGERAFEYSQIEEVVIPDSVKSTRKLVFSGCINLKRVEIGSGLWNIYSCIFTNCRGLEEFIVSPENKTFYSDDGVLIGSNFSYYPSAKKGKYYKIPDKVYGRFYFDDNPYIESIYISDHIKEIMLDGTSSLRTLQVSENNKNFRIVDDVLFDYDMETLLCYPSAKAGQDYVVPATVKGFGVLGSTWNAKELKNIYFSGSCPNSYWVYTFRGEKIYDIYYYDDASWQELREAYNNDFGYGKPQFKMRFHKFQRGSSIVSEYDSIVSDFDYTWLGESVKLKVIEPDLEHGIIKEKVPGFWRTEGDGNKIDNDGTFTGLAEGKEKIIAGGNELSSDIEKEIFVKQKRVQSIKISPLGYWFRDAEIGYKYKMSIEEMLPSNAYDKSVKWYSTDPDIIKVDDQGEFTVMAKGEAEIYCVSQDGGNVESNHCKVCVDSVHAPKKLVEKITIKPESVTIKRGETASLSWSVYPEDAENKAVTWYSTEESVAKVDSAGVVTAVAEGTAEIYCISQDERKVRSNRCVVTVKADDSEDPKPPVQPEKKLVERITIKPESVTIKKGETVSLSQSVYPEDAENKASTWRSTDPSVASVDETGRVRALKQGTAEIYCVSQDGSNIESNHCTVKVISGGSSGGGSGSGGGSSSGGGGSSSGGGGSSSGGGGSSSGGGGSSSGGGGKGPSGETNTSGSETLPSYVVKGSWIQGADGAWSFIDSQGTRYANAWAAVENPYANSAAGQQAFDWFRFDVNGKMVVGWYQDPADGRWYYLSPISDGTLGRMITGWYVIDSSYYYFNPNFDGYRGRMYANEITPDGYYVDGSGRWVQ